MVSRRNFQVGKQLEKNWHGVKISNWKVRKSNFKGQNGAENWYRRKNLK